MRNINTKNIAFKVDEELYKKIKIRLAINGKTLKDYIIKLIENDLMIADYDDPTTNNIINDLEKMIQILKSEQKKEKK